MKSIMTFLVVLLFVSASGQVQNNFHSAKLLNEKGYFQKDHKNHFRQIAPPDTAAINNREAAEKNNGGVRPFRFAEKISVDIDFVKEADWITDSAVDYGRLTFVASKAKSLSIYESAF